MLDYTRLRMVSPNNPLGRKTSTASTQQCNEQGADHCAAKAAPAAEHGGDVSGDHQIAAIARADEELV
jgi:hypothetical protein